MYHKVIIEMTAAEKASFLFREEEVVDLEIIAEMLEPEQFVLLTEILHTHAHQTNKKIISYMAKLCLKLNYYDSSIMYNLKLLKGDNTEYFTSNIYRHLGNAFLAKGDRSLAIDYYEKSLGLSPNNYRLMVLLGDISLEMGEIDKAISYFEKAILLVSDDAAFYKRLGFAYRRKNNLDESIAAFSKSIKLKKDDPWAYYGLGLSFFEAGHYRKAQRMFNVCVKNNWLLAESLYGLALVNLGKNNIKKAKHYFKEAALLDRRLVVAENVPLDGSISKHATAQALLRKVDLEDVKILKNISITDNDDMHVYPYYDNGLWTGCKIVYNLKDKVMITVINYKLYKESIDTRQNSLRDFFKKISLKLPRTASGSARG